MAVHNVRIHTTCSWCVIELRSPGAWARAPGRSLRCETQSSGSSGVAVDIDDRTIRLVQGDQTDGVAALTLHLQVATQEQSVSLLTNKSRTGTLSVAAGASARVNDGTNETNPLQVLLYLDADAALRAGSEPGDSAVTL